MEAHRRLLYETDVQLHKYANERPLNPYKIRVRHILIFNDIIIIAKPSIPAKNEASKQAKDKERDDKDKEKDKFGDTMMSGETAPLWDFRFQMQAEKCKVVNLCDAYDFIASKYTQRNALKLTYEPQQLDINNNDYGHDRKELRLTSSSPEEKQKLLEELNHAITTASRAREAPYT